jgi:hypothetical protein
VSDNGQQAARPVRARTDSPGSAHGPPDLACAKSSENSGFQPFFAAGTAPAEGEAYRDFLKGNKTMHASKFEAFAFTIGFIATGFLTLVALPLAA